MQDTSDRGGGVSTRAIELLVAALLMGVAGIVMSDSLRIGAGWASDGPEAGYFPFYVGLLMLLCSAVVFVRALLPRTGGGGIFVDFTQFRRVLAILLPTAVFVVLSAFIGIYVSAFLFIGYCMLYLGYYPLRKVLPIAIAVPVALFIVFEIWFLVPLPKGPLEEMLGF